MHEDGSEVFVEDYLMFNTELVEEMLMSNDV